MVNVCFHFPPVLESRKVQNDVIVSPRRIVINVQADTEYGPVHGRQLDIDNV